jgi:hypothetical protein
MQDIEDQPLISGVCVAQAGKKKERLCGGRNGRSDGVLILTAAD